MMKHRIPVAKVRTNYRNDRTKQLITIAKQVSESMRTSPTFGGKEWVGCPTNLEKLDATILNLDQADVASLKKDVDVIAKRGVYEEALGAELTKIAHYVSMVADGNEQILRESGLPLLKQPTPKASRYTVDVVDLKVAHGPSQTLLANFTYLGPNWSYRLMVCRADPMVEENWAEAYVGSRCTKVEVHNCEPGGRYFFRVQVIAPDGTTGSWSQVVSIIAL